MSKKKQTPSASDLPSQSLPSSLRTQIQTKLLDWYRYQHRDLPWRNTQDPYAIWISEIMLQQTRVATVKDYYRRFLKRFPTPLDLSNAPLEDVLAMWSGLGYYTRARNLHKAAHQIAQTYAGNMPKDKESILALPGIGPYTAGAILSIAFGESAPLVDGNVIRVLSRLFAISDPLESAKTQNMYWRLATSLVPKKSPPQNDPGDFNQGLMELGATVCLPQNPTCFLCPLKQECQAQNFQNKSLFPPKKQERSIPTLFHLVLVVQVGNKVLLGRRPEVGLWGGLFEFPLLEVDDFQNSDSLLFHLAKERLGIDIDPQTSQITPLPPFEQRLTHRLMKFMPFRIRLQKKCKDPKSLFYQKALWIDPQKPAALGLSVWVSKLLSTLAKESHVL